MYITITLFYISIIGIALMLVLKRREVCVGHESMFSKIGRNSDHIFHAIFSKINSVIRYINKHTFIAIAQWIAFHILVRVRKVYVHLKHAFIQTQNGKKMIDAIRGRGEIKNHGASFYLKHIGHGKGK